MSSFRKTNGMEKGEVERSPLKGTPKNVSEAHTVFPLNRIRTIMKSSPDVLNIGQDGLFLMTKAVEFFVENLVMNAYDGRMNDRKQLEYEDLASYVQDCDELEFLHEILPRKRKVEDILRELEGESITKPGKPDHSYS